MEFNKYIKKGAYHWKMYLKNPRYKRHVDYVVKWVRPGRILDIGAGDGLITLKLGAEGIDDNERAIKLANEKRVNVRWGSAYDLPTEKKYNRICLLDVIEHLKEYKLALEQIKKILDEDGELYICTPLYTGTGKYKGLHSEYHYFEWTPEQFQSEMEQSGFTMISLVVKSGLCRMYGKFKL